MIPTFPPISRAMTGEAGYPRGVPEYGNTPASPVITRAEGGILIFLPTSAEYSWSNQMRTAGGLGSGILGDAHHG